ncbi:MAG: Mur ligase family protein, partial [Oscillospiraceae bacterium]
LFSEIKCNKKSCSLKDNADYRAEDVKITHDSLCYNVVTAEKSLPVSLKMTGEFNIMNSMQAAAACLEMRIPDEKISSALSSVSGVKGRCEIIPTGKDFTVICDYAHSPDGIKNILSALKPFAKNRLICLFGCGGDRDKTKRPKMAAAAAEYADRLIVTSDNPRNEEPADIIKDILVGLENTNVPYDTIENRKEAIKHALMIGEKGDIIVLAGKGHEDYQILKGYKKIHFDEREIVAELLKEI